MLLLYRLCFRPKKAAPIRCQGTASQARSIDITVGPSNRCSRYGQWIGITGCRKPIKLMDDTASRSKERAPLAYIDVDDDDAVVVVVWHQQVPVQVLIVEEIRRPVESMLRVQQANQIDAVHTSKPINSMLMTMRGRKMGVVGETVGSLASYTS